MRNRRPSPEHEQAVARRLALLAAEWDTAKAAGARDEAVSVPGVAAEAAAGPAGAVAPGGEWPWNPPTRVAGGSKVEVERPAVKFEVIRTTGLDELQSDEVESAAEDESPPLVRAPGRHAARRGLAGALGGVAPGVTGWFVSPVAGARARLTSAHLTWVAVLVALALGATCWWLVGAKESAVLTPVSASFNGPGSSESAGEGSGAASAGPETQSPQSPPDAASGGAGSGEAESGGVGEVVVDVAGKVRRPGIVVLAAGSRVADALDAAGGAKRGVDLTSLNLARRLLDGEQILVGKSAAAGAGAAPAPGAPAAPSGTLVNLNSASQTELETLPGVGPVTAAAIIEWRGRHGGFTAVEDLLEVDGIGEATLKRLAPLVSV